MQLLFVRHGQTTSNVAGLIDSGAPGPSLTALGRAQAAAVPGALAGRVLGGIHVSTLVRTAQTAAPLAAELARVPREHDGLREIQAGDLEMADDPDSYRRYVAAAWAWAVGDLDAPMPGAPGGREFFERFDAAVEDIVREGEDLPVVFSHGAAIRVWAAGRCVGIEPEVSLERALHNTGSVLVERSRRGRWTLVEWNEHPIGGVVATPSSP